MATTFTKIASVTVGAGGASSIDFTSIPSTYTDLCVKTSIRWSGTGDGNYYLQFNGNTSSVYSYKALYGDPNAGSAGSYGSASATSSPAGSNNWSTWTANTFSSSEIYIPNYAGSNNKSFNIDGVSENNASTAYEQILAGLFSSSSAISSIKLYPPSGTFVQYSTSVLYGIKNS